MSKSVCTLTKRSDFSRAAFQDYYENNHATLAIRHFAFRRYVRNHVIGSAEIGFDTLSEFWSDDMGALAALMNTELGDVMRADEQRFMDQSRIAAAGAREHVLSEGPPADTEGNRFAILLSWDGEPSDVEASILEWAASFARSAPGVSLDLVSSWSEQAFPGRAVLWAPQAALPSSRPSWLRLQTVHVRRIETPPNHLLGRKDSA